MPTVDLIYDVLDYCNIRDLVPVAALNSFHTNVVQKYICQRSTIMASQFFTDTDAFSRMLTDCHAGVSGSAALHFMLPTKTTDWTPNDLDIYAPSAHYISICARMQNMGYVIIGEKEFDQTPYSSSQIEEVVTFSNTSRIIQVIFSSTYTALTPIFEFHSTAVMNFVSPDLVLCAYPDLTFQHLSLINPAPIYLDLFSISVADALRKYNDRGFRYIDCATAGTCTTNVRSLTDSKCFWMNLKQTPLINNAPANLLAAYNIADVRWVLGGKICAMRTRDSFVLPHVQIIQNQPYDCCLFVLISSNHRFSFFLQSSSFNGSFNLPT